MVQSLWLSNTPKIQKPFCAQATPPLPTMSTGRAQKVSYSNCSADRLTGVPRNKKQLLRRQQAELLALSHTTKEYYWWKRLFENIGLDEEVHRSHATISRLSDFFKKNNQSSRLNSNTLTFIITGFVKKSRVVKSLFAGYRHPKYLRTALQSRFLDNVMKRSSVC
jgi:hypothetical protein